MGRPPSERPLTAAERKRAERARRRQLKRGPTPGVAIAGPADVPAAIAVVRGARSTGAAPADAPAWDYGPLGYDPIDDQIARAVREADAAHQLLPTKRPSISEEDYVAHRIAALKASGVSMAGERGLRAERYQRWRYRGYCAGVVASL